MHAWMNSYILSRFQRISFSQGYTSKGCILIQTIPVPDVYTKFAHAWHIENMHHQIWYTHWGQEVPE